MNPERDFIVSSKAAQLARAWAASAARRGDTLSTEIWLDVANAASDDARKAAIRASAANKETSA